MIDSREATLRDEQLIKTITEGLSLDNPNDIRKIYSELQSGAYTFESQVGRDFDDNIFELMEKVKLGEIQDPLEAKKNKKKADKKQKEKTSKSETIKKEPKRTKAEEKEINLLASELLKKKEKKRKTLTIVAMIVALGSLSYFGVYYFLNFRTGMNYETLANLKGSRTLASASSNTDKGINLNLNGVVTPDILPEYETLFKKNMKLAGWLTIDGTNIDYPVMQTSDNEYYLNHNFDQQKDNNGSLFLDCSCSLYPRSTNMIIYGHHMKSGSMFGNLNKYANEKYGKEHSIIHFDTIYEHATYEVMYVFYSKVYDNDELVFKYYQFIEANSEKEFNSYMEEMKSISLYDTGVTASFGDSLLTLSTCDYSQADGRFAVVAKRIN